MPDLDRPVSQPSNVIVHERPDRRTPEQRARDIQRTLRAQERRVVERRDRQNLRWFALWVLASCVLGALAQSPAVSGVAFLLGLVTVLGVSIRNTRGVRRHDGEQITPATDR